MKSNVSALAQQVLLETIEDFSCVEGKGYRGMIKHRAFRAILSSLLPLFVAGHLFAQERPCASSGAVETVKQELQVLGLDQVRRVHGGFEVLQHHGDGYRVQRVRTWEEAQRAAQNTADFSFKSWIARHEAVYPEIRSRLQVFERQLPEVRFTSRIKDSQSLKDKFFDKVLEKGPGYRLEQIQDTAGFRFVVGQKSDVRTVAEAIKREFGADIVDETIRSNNRGYRAHHLIARTPSGVNFEIQVMTERMKEAATWTHDRIYKAPGIYSPEYLRKLNGYGFQLLDYFNALDDGVKAPRMPDPTGIRVEDLFPNDKLIALSRPTQRELDVALTGELKHAGFVDRVPQMTGPMRMARSTPAFKAPAEPKPRRLPLNSIRFMQNGVKFAHGSDSPYTVVGNARLIRNGQLSPNDLGPVQVWMDKSGKVWALDHRRLVAYHLSGRVDDVPVEWMPEEFVKNDSFKFTTADDGNTLFIPLPDSRTLVISREGEMPESSRRLYGR